MLVGLIIKFSYNSSYIWFLTPRLSPNEFSRTNFSGWEFSGLGVFPGGNFPGGIFQDEIGIWINEFKYEALSAYKYRALSQFIYWLKSMRYKICNLVYYDFCVISGFHVPMALPLKYFIFIESLSYCQLKMRGQNWWLPSNHWAETRQQYSIGSRFHNLYIENPIRA